MQSSDRCGLDTGLWEAKDEFLGESSPAARGERRTGGLRPPRAMLRMAQTPTPQAGMRCRCIKGSSIQWLQGIENSGLDLSEIRCIKSFPLIRAKGIEKITKTFDPKSLLRSKFCILPLLRPEEDANTP